MIPYNAQNPRDISDQVVILKDALPNANTRYIIPNVNDPININFIMIRIIMSVNIYNDSSGIPYTISVHGYNTLKSVIGLSYTTLKYSTYSTVINSLLLTQLF